MAGGGREGVGEARRDDDEISSFGGDDPVSRQELGGAVEQVEQLGGIGMAVRPTTSASAERTITDSVKLGSASDMFGYLPCDERDVRCRAG